MADDDFERKDKDKDKDKDKRSWWQKTFGRSILKAIVGDFFSEKNNTASIIAICLVITICYLVIFRERYELIERMMNVIFVVIGYYFGARNGKREDSE